MFLWDYFQSDGFSIMLRSFEDAAKVALSDGLRINIVLESQLCNGADDDLFLVLRLLRSRGSHMQNMKLQY